MNANEDIKNVTICCITVCYHFFFICVGVLYLVVILNSTGDFANCDKHWKAKKRKQIANTNLEQMNNARESY